MRQSAFSLFFIMFLQVNVLTSTPVNTKSVYLQEPGILIEPRELVLHHSDVFHTTIAINLDSALPEARKDLYANCKKHTARADLTLDFKKRTDNIIQSLPKENLYRSESLICDFTGINCSKIPDEERSHISARSKRFVNIPITATIFGIVSIGMGLYTYLSQQSLKEHVENVESHIRVSDQMITSNSEYSQLSASMFAKNYARSKLFESSLQNTLCSLEKGQMDDHLNLAVTEYLDYLMYNVQHSVDGHVTDFLISRELLNATILNQTSLLNSVYTQDHGLFYSTSTSFLTHVNAKTKMLYFLVVTPRAFPKDLTTLYSVTNMGWIEGDYHFRYETSESFYQVYWENISFPVETRKEDCLSRAGLLICHSQTSTSSAKARCLHQLLNKSSVTECRIQREYSPHKPCTVRHVLSGILAQNCKSVTLTKIVRGIIMEDPVKNPEFQTRFFPYSSFQTAVIEGKSYITRDTIFQTELRKVTPSSELTVPELPPLYSPTEISELMSFIHEKKREEEQRSIPQQFSHSLASHFIWFLILLIFLVLCVSLLMYKITKLTRTNSVYTHMLQEVSTPQTTQLRMRSRRGRNTDS